MRSIREAILALSTVLLALAAIFCFLGTALCRGGSRERDREQSYREAEQKYVQEVRAFLEEKGYRSSGVTMNRVVEEDGTREYTINIHHRRIEALDSESRRDLEEECRAIEFPIEGCSFYQKFF